MSTCIDIKRVGHLVFTECNRIDILSVTFLNRVESALESFGSTLLVNCAYRDAEEDRRKGRSGTSYHCKGRALDLSTRGLGGAIVRDIVLRFMNAGLTVGIYKTFIHVDDRDTPILFYGE